MGSFRLGLLDFGDPNQQNPLLLFKPADLNLVTCSPKDLTDSNAAFRDAGMGTPEGSAF